MFGKQPITSIIAGYYLGQIVVQQRMKLQI